MADFSELRAALHLRSQLEDELSQLHPQISPLEREIKKLQIEANNRQADVEALSGGLRARLLSLTGKKEAAMTQAVREARAARERLSTATFRLETLQSRIQAINEELSATDRAEADLLAALEEPPEEAQALLHKIQQAQALQKQLSAAMGDLKHLLLEADKIYAYGDIQTDLTGHRYDNKFHTMQNIAFQCQPILDRLNDLLAQYTARYALTLDAAAPGPWTEDPAYLTERRFDARDLYERTDSVFCWLQRLNRTLRAQQPQRDAADLADRQALRSLLCNTP